MQRIEEQSPCNHSPPISVSARERVLDYLESCDLRYTRREQVADALGLQGWELTRALECEGVRFRELLQQERMNRAKTLLEYNPRMGAPRVAEVCGYANTTSFRKAFQAWFGLGYGEYRRLQETVNILNAQTGQKGTAKVIREEPPCWY